MEKTRQNWLRKVFSRQGRRDNDGHFLLGGEERDGSHGST
jgi:hypothetical protein